MEFTVQIFSENDAFSGDPSFEISRILHELADELGEGGFEGTVRLHDVNGNSVGIARLA